MLKVGEEEEEGGREEKGALKVNALNKEDFERGSTMVELDQRCVERAVACVRCPACAGCAAPRPAARRTFPPGARAPGFRLLRRSSSSSRSRQ